VNKKREVPERERERKRGGIMASKGRGGKKRRQEEEAGGRRQEDGVGRRVEWQRGAVIKKNENSNEFEISLTFE